MKPDNQPESHGPDAPSKSGAPLYALSELLAILPHRPPFLFVDEVVSLEPGQSIHARRMLRSDEPQFAGHFPGRPIMPGVLVAEALAQTSGLLLGLSERLASTVPPTHPKIFFLATTNIKFTHPSAPGDVLELHCRTERNFGSLYRFNVEASVGRHAIASGSLTLALMETQRKA
jgi:3-hydroxyacyl-[acyl-carrier-protein] dehydratase